MAQFEILDDTPAGRFEILDDAKKDVSAMDRVKAGAAGVNKGFFSNLAGLPVDTVANVLDLGKSAFGTVAGALGRRDLMPEVSSDRSSIIGSSDWLAKNINKGSAAIGMPSPINNPNPQDPWSRVAHMGGQVAGGSVSPDPRSKVGAVQQLVNFGMGGAGGIAAGSTAESYPEWAGVAGMLPAAGAASGIAAFKLGIRGGEQSRKSMEQRIQDLKNGGVDTPSLGLSTANRGLLGVENILAQTPGSAGVYEKARAKNVEGMQNKTREIRDAVSDTFGPVVAGEAIQADLKGPFKDRVSNTYSKLNDRVEEIVGPNSRIPVDESIARSGLLSMPVGGAEATSSNFINSRIRKINGDLTADAGGTPSRTITGAIVGQDGLPLFSQTIPGTPPQGVPFSAIKDLRTKIGKEAASNAIMGTPEQADFKQLYGAMSQDMKNGVSLADLRNGVLPANAGSGTTALNRANSFYGKAMGRADDLSPLANRSTPEGAYGAVANSLNAGPTVYERLRSAVTPETRQKVASTIIDELGTATPGQQNAAGEAWSARTFLTNYSKLHENGGGKALFTRLPGGEKHADNLADIAKTAEMLTSGSKVWANPSGTAPAMTARGTLYALTAGAFFHPLIAAGTAAGLAGGNVVSQRLLLNPVFVNWLAKSPTIPPAEAKAYVQRLMANVTMSRDKQFKIDIGDYLGSVEENAK